MSIYTVKTSKLPFSRILQKLGCQRKWILKTFLIENFNKVSDFESRKSLGVKIILNFAITSDFETIVLQLIRLQRQCVFYNTDFEETFAFGRTTFGAFYNVKTTKLAVLCFLLQNESEKNTGLANSFWIKNFDTIVSVNQLFPSSIVFEWKNLQRVTLGKNIFKTYHVFLLQIRFWRKLCFRKVNFCSFLYKAT